MKGASNKVFIPSGCLSLKGMISYREGRLTEKEMQMAVEHIDRCGLCKETLDQLTTSDDIDAFSKAVETINKQLKERLAAENTTKGHPPKKLKIRSFYRVAASILIVVGVLFYLHKVLEQNAIPDLANEQMEKETPALFESSGEAATESSNRPLAYFLEEAVITMSDKYHNQRHEALVMESQTTLSARMKAKESTTDSGQKPAEEINAGMSEQPTSGQSLGSHFFNPLEAMPEFPGGFGALQYYLVSQLDYPENAQKAKIQGRVLLTFIIDEHGQPGEISIIRGIGGGCDEEAARVIGAMPSWKPATQEGKPVRVMFTLPVKFEMI